MTDATDKPFPSRWGPGDELGALNLVTPESTLAALAMIKQAKTYDLSHVLEPEMPVPGFHGQFFANTQFTLENGEEWHHKYLGVMKNGYSAQNLRINMSDQSGTHIDNLNHIGQRQADGDYYLYNNVRNKDVIDTFGTRRLGMENVPAFIARGILVDVAGHLGQDILPAGYAIQPDEIDAAREAQGGTEVRQGDVVFIHTGWGKHWEDPETLLSGEPGLGKACAGWANEHDIMMWGLDQFAVDPIPFETEGECLPIHIEMLSKSGIRLIENVYLEEIVREKVYEFCVIGAPLRFKGGTGSPIRLLAMI